MALVTEVNQLAPNNRTTQRMPVNPLDICTIVSIFPERIVEKKHTIQPGIFIIPKGSYEIPGILHVGPSSWWKDVGPEQDLVEIPTSSVLIADSVIRDWANGLLACNMGDRMPGLFWVPGEKEIGNILTEHRRELDIALARQRNWYEAQVKIADTLWARTQGNPVSISNHARLAAQELGLKNKPWMQDFSTIQMKNCPMCGHLWNPAFPMCGNCKTIIDPKRVEELSLKQVE